MVKAREKRYDFSRDSKVAWLAHDRTSYNDQKQRSKSIAILSLYHNGYALSL